MSIYAHHINRGDWVELRNVETGELISGYARADHLGHLYIEPYEYLMNHVIVSFTRRAVRTMA